MKLYQRLGDLNKNAAEENRIRYVDYIKAIVIFTVILGHTPFCNNLLKQWIYTFHMPAFFAVYGMTWNREKHERKGYLTLDFVIKKAKRLLLPCFIWGIIYGIPLTLKEIAYVFYGSQMAYARADSLTSLWFLPCMFIAVLLFEGAMSLLKKKNGYEVYIILSITAVLCSWLSLMLPRIGLGYPWSINVAFMAYAFIVIGYLLQILIRMQLFTEKLFQLLLMAGTFVPL